MERLYLYNNKKLILNINLPLINILTMEFSPLSEQITKSLSKVYKREHGIYFTPPTSVQKTLDILKQYMVDVVTVLEPSCGSCEYISALQSQDKPLQSQDKPLQSQDKPLQSQDKPLQITGIEYCKEIYDEIAHFNTGNTQILNQDYITYKPQTKFDLIIGNPPFYVMKKGDVGPEYHRYFGGRPNIFILFIIKSLQLLNKGGILSFILPKSFTNCLYYNKTREYIYNNFQILNISDCSDDKYIETQQDTILFIVKRQDGEIDNSDFVMEVGGYKILTFKDDIIKLRNLYTNSTNLHNLGFKVSVGTVVWNQCKDILTDNVSDTRLIYSSDIKDGTVIKQNYKNEAKKNHIQKDGIKDIMLVVNRGYGTGKYCFNYCLIDVDYDYLIENHLICIKYELATDRYPFDMVIKSLNDVRTREFIDIYFGNSAMNTTELTHILPIYQ